MTMRFMEMLGVLLMSASVFVQGLAPQHASPPRPAQSPAARPAASSYDESVAKARAFLKDNKFKEALEASEQAIKIDDKRWEAYVTAATAYSSQGLMDDAIGMLQQSLVRAPQDRKPLIRDAIAETRKAMAVAAAQPATGATPAAAAPDAGASPTQAEIVLWKSIENSKTAADFSGFLSAYPDGIYAPVAKARLTAINDASKTPQQKVADLVSQVVKLTNNVNVGGATQSVFAAGCKLSVVRNNVSDSIDLKWTNVNDLQVVGENGAWSVSGLLSDTARSRKVRFLFYAADQAGVSQLFALLPQAIALCSSHGNTQVQFFNEFGKAPVGTIQAGLARAAPADSGGSKRRSR